MRKIRFSDWVAGAEERRRRADLVRRAFAQPYCRERPRDPEKARLLRERGTTEHLIGPEREAGRALLAADPVPVPDIEQLKGELDEIRAGAHD